MAKHNYSAWHINPKEFSENWSDIQKLQFFARYAILAPSGHNTQPWHFSQEEQSLLLKINHTRRLPYSGVEANEPWVSLGACLGTFRLAAAGFGYNIVINYILRGDDVAAITLTNKIKTKSTLLTAITKRVSNRNYYETSDLSEELIIDLTKTTFANISYQVVSSKDDIEFIAKQTSQATYKIFSDKAFREELSKWVRNNITKQHDGMPGFVQGIPTPPSLFAKHIIKRINISKDQAKKDANRIIHSGNLLLINVKDSSQEALLNAGDLYAQVCVLAQEQGIASSGLGTAIIEPDAKKEIVNKLKLDGQPIAIIRLGKTTKHARHTPRWPFSKVSD